MTKKKKITENIEEIVGDLDIPKVEDIISDLDNLETDDNSVNATGIKREEKLLTSEYLNREFTTEEEESATEIHNMLTAHLEETCGVTPGSAIRTTVPTGIDLLDTVLGGGIAPGLVQIVGPAGSGKSALASRIIAAGQKKWPGKFNAVYIDSENAMLKQRLAELGIKHPRLEPYTTKVTVEKVFQIIQGIVSMKESILEKNKKSDIMNMPYVVVWDSIANTPTELAMAINDVNKGIGQKARALSFFLPNYVPIMNQYNIFLVAVNQLRDKIDMGIVRKPNELKYLSGKTIPGGQAIIFNSIQIIYLRATSDMKGEYGFNGSRALCRTIKNKLFTPNISIDLAYSFEKGFSNFFTNYEMLKKAKRITTAAFCSLKTRPDDKFRQSGLIKRYREDLVFKKAFDDEVKDVLQSEYLDVYASTEDDRVD